MELDVRPKSVRDLIDHNLLIRHRAARDILDRFRNSIVVRALKLCNGNLTKTGELLQLDKETLRRWMRDSGINRYYR
jgi:DNA-binding NtrC family response regulator